MTATPLTTAAIHRMCDESEEILSRTARIVQRLMPRTPTPHGWYDPEGFIASCRYRDARERLFHEIKPRIAAKVRKRSDAYLQFLAKGQRTFERQERRAAHRRGEAA